jgi:hypothetical protein
MIRRTTLMSIALVFAFVASAHAADITGTWKASFDTQIGVQNYTYTFKVEGSKLTGHAKSEYADVDIQEGTIKGDDITFVESFDFQGMPIRIVYKGKISGDEIKLSRNVADIATEEAVAKRAK